MCYNGDISYKYISAQYRKEIFDGKKTLGQAVEQAEKLLDKRGPAGMCEGNIVPGNLARPRIQEIYACMNRYRKLGTDRKERG